MQPSTVPPADAHVPGSPAVPLTGSATRAPAARVPVPSTATATATAVVDEDDDSSSGLLLFIVLLVTACLCCAALVAALLLLRRRQRAVRGEPTCDVGKNHRFVDVFEQEDHHHEDAPAEMAAPAGTRAAPIHVVPAVGAAVCRAPPTAPAGRAGSPATSPRTAPPARASACAPPRPPTAAPKGRVVVTVRRTSTGAGDSPRASCRESHPHPQPPCGAFTNAPTAAQRGGRSSPATRRLCRKAPAGSPTVQPTDPAARGAPRRPAQSAGRSPPRRARSPPGSPTQVVYGSPLTPGLFQQDGIVRGNI